MSTKSMVGKHTQGSLDTNVLLRFVLNDVPAHTQAIDVLLEKGGIYHIEDVVIVEMVFVLEKVYQMPRKAVVENVRTVVNHKQFMCTRRVFEHALPIYVTHTSLSFMDCILLAYACAENRTPLYSFDKALVKHSGGDARAIVK